MFVRCISKRIFLPVFIALLAGATIPALAAHSAFVVMGYDAYPVPFFTGISSPTGPSQINVVSGNPGFLNNLSGGSNGGATGNVSVNDAQFTNFNATELVALAIQVTDSAGPQHSLSADSDPALGDIVNDLNNSSFGGVFIASAYPFASVPSEFQSAANALSSGEQTLGKPFDILLSITDNWPGFPFNQLAWASDFSNEVGNLDGITSLKITDADAAQGPVVPEPACGSLVLLFAAVFLRRRSR